MMVHVSIVVEKAVQNAKPIATVVLLINFRAAQIICFCYLALLSLRSLIVFGSYAGWGDAQNLVIVGMYIGSLS